MVFEMVKQIKDWRVPIVQTFLPLLVIPLVLFFDVTRKITNFLEKTNIDVKDLGIEWQIASSLGNGAVIVTILFLYMQQFGNITVKKFSNRTWMHVYGIHMLVTGFADGF